MIQRRSVLLALSTLFLFQFIFSCEAEQRQRPELAYERSNPSDNSSRFPYLYTPDGETLYMSWLTRIEEQVASVEFARYRDGIWETPRTVAVGTMIPLQWKDEPMLRPDVEEQPLFYWLRRRDGEPPVLLPQLSFPAGEERRWSQVTPLPEPAATDHRYGSLVRIDQERLLLLWVDTAGSELLSSIIEGETAGEPETVIGELCPGQRPAAGESQRGPVLLLTRCEAGESPGLLLLRLDPETLLWGDPAELPADGARISLDAAASPAVAVAGEELMAAWFSEENGERSMHLHYSSDGGESFGQSVHAETGPDAGRVRLAASEGSGFHAVWMERQGSLSAVRYRSFLQGEPRDGPVRIGTTDTGIESGFPALAVLGQGVMFAWTQTEPFYRVRTAFYRFDTVAEP